MMIYIKDVEGGVGEEFEVVLVNVVFCLVEDEFVGVEGIECLEDDSSGYGVDEVLLYGFVGEVI